MIFDRIASERSPYKASVRLKGRQKVIGKSFGNASGRWAEKILKIFVPLLAVCFGTDDT